MDKVTLTPRETNQRRKNELVLILAFALMEFYLEFGNKRLSGNWQSH